MNGFCTYTVEVHDEAGARDVLCSKPRIGEVLGHGIGVVLCRRHFQVVANAMKRRPNETMALYLDDPVLLPVDSDV